MENKLNDINDINFILYDQLQIEQLCGSRRFADHSKDTFDMILDAAEKMAVNDFLPVNSEGDRIGCSWKDGKVQVPEPFHAPFKRYCEGGWINMPEEYDVSGQNVPLVVNFACQEMFFAACHSLTGYMGLTHSAAKVIERYGNEDQKKKYMIPLYEGRYAGGMNLTEAQAGSDVGAVRTRAVRNQDGTYSITGTKIFITGGEQDLTENITHIVLARIEGHPQGTKGLSCFVVPKIRVNEDGSLGEENDVKCTGIEHKMGMKGSATCVLNYGDNGGCIGELLGPEQQGIIVMFTMMNEQRALVGLQGLAQASAAYLHALKYAKERLQGTKFGSRNSKQVAIIEHPEIKRNLATMKAYTEGMRSLVLYLAFCMDVAESTVDENVKRKMQDIVDVLIPVCKAYCTDKGFEVCSRAMQVHGGYGYCTEYKVEQFTRDCKITSIYEGANGIQALDLFGRKIKMRDGAALERVFESIAETVREAFANDELAPYAGELQVSVSDLRNLTETLNRVSVSENAYLAYSWATPYLELFGDVVLAWLLLWQAKSAAACITAKSANEIFYKNKINTAKFYIGSLLPVVIGKMKAIKKNDNSIMFL